MAEEQTKTGLLNIDINKIISSSNPYKKYEYEVIVHTEERDITIDQVRSIETMREYNTNMGDYVVINFNMYLGDYVKDVYAYKDNVMCTITKNYLDTDLTDIVTTYKLIVINDGGAIENNSFYKDMSKTELNQKGLIQIEAQLYQIEIEGLKQFYVDGNYSNLTVKNLLLGLFGDARKYIEVNGQALEFVVYMFDPNNTLEYENIFIPTGIRLADLGTYLQNTSYGVYNGGIGTYLQMNEKNKLCLYIYPLYSQTRYLKKKKEKILTIFKADTDKLDVVDNTYILDGDSIKMFTGSNTKVTEKATDALQDGGDTLISSQSDEVLNRNADITASSFQMDKSEQLKGVSVVNRKDGMKKAKYVGPESNMYKVRTDAIRNTMTFIQVTWHFSNQEMIYPGMPVCYSYEDTINGIVNLYGTVQALYTKFDKVNNTTSSILVIAVGSLFVYGKGE